jgi:HK97 family phage portal protein
MNWRERLASLSPARFFKSREVRADQTLTPINIALSAGVNLTGFTVTEKSVLSLTAAFACINVISTDLSSLPLILYRRRKSGGRDEITDHDAGYRLRWSPDDSDAQSSVKLRQDWMGHTLGWGNGFIQVKRSGDGTISSFNLLDPSKTQAARRSTDGGVYYVVGNSATLAADEVLHLAGLGFDGLSGYSPPKLVKQAFALGLAMETFGSGFFGNGSKAGGWLKVARKMSPEAIRNLRESFEYVHRGTYNAHRIGILEEGMDFVNSQISPEDAQFLASRQFQVIEVCRIYRVPPNKVGDYSQAHLANVEASNLDYITTTLRPWAVSTENTCSLKLLTPKERRKGLYFEHQLAALLRGDMKARVEYYTRMRDAGSLCPDEIRDFEGLNPIEGGIGQIYLVPANLVPLKKMDVDEEEDDEVEPGAGADEVPDESGDGEDGDENGDPAAVGAVAVPSSNGNGNGKPK